MKYCLLTFNEDQPATTVLDERFASDDLEKCYEFLRKSAKFSSIDDYYQIITSDFDVISEGYVESFTV